MSDAAQIIALHQGCGPQCVDNGTFDGAEYWECWGCTWEGPSVEAHAAHVLAVLSETHAVVELPEPDPDIGAYFNAGCGAVAHVQEGDVRLHSVDYKVGLRGGVLRSPAKATELAAALLAAARVAEATR